MNYRLRFSALLATGLVACSGSTSTAPDTGVHPDAATIADTGPRPDAGGNGGVTTIDITAPVLSVEVGSTITLLAVPRNRAGGAVNAAVTWTAADTNIATINGMGVVTGVSEGTTNMTATASGVTASVPITVVAVSTMPVASVEVQPAVTQITAGSTAQVTAVLRDAANNILAGRTVTWMSSTPNFFTVDNSGVITAIAEGSGAAVATSEGVSGNAPVVVAGGPMGGDVTVNPAITYQTMDSLEVTAQGGAFECAGYENWKDEIIRRGVDEIGATRVRLEIRGSMEHPRDIWREFTTGAIDSTQWRALRYEIINDDNNPNNAVASRFHFSELDDHMNAVVLAMRQRVMSQGKRFYININYADFGASSFEHYQDPNEYAEFMLEVFRYMDRTYGFVPDGIEPILEPDLAPGWSAQQLGAVISVTGARLAAAGYTPDFISPSCTDTTAAVSYFDTIWAMPNVRTYLKEFAYHRYSGDPGSVLASIGQRGMQNNIRTSMLEHIGSGHRRMIDDIRYAMNSVWSPYALAFCIPDNTGLVFSIDNSNPNNPRVNIGFEARYIGHYWRYMQQGAVRTEVSGTGDMIPLAFRNPDNTWNVVIAKDSGGTFTVGGLPDGAYGVFYSTATEYDVALPDVQISGGVAAQVSLPAAGVITLHSR